MMKNIHFDMLRENEYLGFAIRKPEGAEAFVYLFEMLPEGVKRYGGYKILGEVEKHTPSNKATILSIFLLDGTMPMPIDEFDRRIRNGEASGDKKYNMFISAEMLGSVEFKNPKTKTALDNGENSAVRTMFYQCVKCLKDVEKKAKSVKAKQKRKS